jgi:hypothetical protein
MVGPRASVKARIRRRRNRVEEEEALRTCEELLAVENIVSKLTRVSEFSIEIQLTSSA